MSFRSTAWVGAAATALTLACAGGASDPAPSPAQPPSSASQPPSSPAQPPSSDPQTPPSPPQTTAPIRTLVLYDDGGPWGWLGEVYAIQAGQLASHFGGWEARPVGSYRAGDAAERDLLVYVGSTWNQPLPEAFLDDVAAGAGRVLWLGANLSQLVARVPDFTARYGFALGLLETGPISEVRYKGEALARAADNRAGIMTYAQIDAGVATEVATAVRTDGSTFPWALRSRQLTYVGEIPFAYAGAADRSLALADLLFDALEPGAFEQHRALVRIEDVTPVTAPETIRAIADRLHALGVPFSISVVPIYVDALGTYSPTGAPETVRLRDAPALVAALRDAVSGGAELVMHGVTHQLGATANPYVPVSTSDFEFWTAHVDAQDRVVLDGPVPEDSAEWARSRIERGLDEFEAAGLPRPGAFEYPHYAGSAADSQAIAAMIPTAYQRGFYFGGLLSGTADPARFFGQSFPYVVRDVYGWKVVPENLGSYQPVAYNAGVPVILVDDLVRFARAQRVVRDGVASFFFHPFLDLATLEQIVTGIQGEGYTFVSPSSL